MADPRINVILGARDEATKVVTGLRGQFERFKQDAVAGFGLGAGISAFSLLQRGVGTVVDVMGDAIGAASALSETQAKVGQVYKTTGAQVLAWGEDWNNCSDGDKRNGKLHLCKSRQASASEYDRQARAFYPARVTCDEET